MNEFDAFGIVWCTGVALAIIVNTAWAINDLKKRSARNHFFGQRVERAEEPFEFWMAVGGKLIVIPIGIFMLWFGSGIFLQPSS